MSDSAEGAPSLDSSPFDGTYLRVTPEPAPQEMAAIAAAVHVLQLNVAAATDVSDRTTAPVMSRWARAARLDVMRGIAEEFA